MNSLIFASRRAGSRISACLQAFLFLFGLSAIVVGFIGAHKLINTVSFTE